MSDAALDNHVCFVSVRKLRAVGFETSRRVANIINTVSKPESSQGEMALKSALRDLMRVFGLVLFLYRGAV